jgi:putative SOS response-associated peptidase YedK
MASGVTASAIRLMGMCGRYTNTRTDPQEIAARFEITISDATAEQALGRMNIAPTQSVLAVVNGEDGNREATLARFGLTPAWGKLRGGPSLINTRDDKLASSGAWKPLVRTAAHRALVVADGYYEWQKPEDPKQTRQPFYHRLPCGELFAFAGLWTTATPKDAEEPITSCSIITTAANRDVRFVHDRMPVILDGPDAEAAWLNPDVDLDGALELARPLPDGRLEVYAVSTRVNNARHQDADLTEPLPTPA